MRRFHLGAAALALPVLAFSLVLVGCSKDTPSTPKGSDQTTEGPKPTGPAKVLEPGKAVLKGKIAWKGSADLAALTADLQKQIAAKADQKDYCLKGGESEKTEQQYRVGDNKQVGNVFVWVRPEAGTFFKVDDNQLAEAKKSPVVIHQPHCAFIPHSAILFAAYPSDPNDPRNPKKEKRTDQYAIFKNDAEVSHNTDYSGGAPKNPAKNLSLKPMSQSEEKDFVPSNSKPVYIKCGIHPWMNAYLWVLDTPYYSISRSDTLDPKGPLYSKPEDANFGTYEIKNLPVGKVRVLAWHEAGDPGWLNKENAKGETFELKEGENTMNFELGK